MALYDEIVALGMDITPAGRNDAEIAEALSVGRTKLVPTEVGTGTIIETLGLTAGNVLLDAIYANSNFKYIKNLLDQGRLRIDSQMVRATLDSFVGNGLTSSQVEALKNLAVQPDPVSTQQVTQAFEGH